MRRRIGLIMLSLMLAGCTTKDTTSTTTALDETSVAATAIETTTEELTTETETSIAGDTDYEVTAQTARLLGRTYFNNHCLWMAYSASGAEFKIKGKAASVMLYGDSTAVGLAGDGTPNKNGNKARFAIYLDGELFMDSFVEDAVLGVDLFSGEEEREVVVKIIKLSETAQSCMGIKYVTVTDGTMEPTENKELYLEFVGDSITCGYGVDDEDRTHSFSTSTEDATKAYAYRTAELLDADYSLVSISGYGIISGYSSDGKIRDGQILSKYYDKLGFSYGKCAGFAVQNWDWNFERQPDAIVINLGTNDDSYVKNDADKKTAYVEGYVAFLKQVREKNPNAIIVCALGIMGDNLYPQVEEAVKQYSEETGDKNVSAFHFDPIKSDEGYAADWHPTSATHERCAAELADYLKELL